LLVAHVSWFYFTPLRGFFSPFSRGYCCVYRSHRSTLALTRWSRDLRIHTGFHVLRATRIQARPVSFSSTGLLPSLGRRTSKTLSSKRPWSHIVCPHNPMVETIVLAVPCFASPAYSGRFPFFTFFLQLLRMFQFAGLGRAAYGSAGVLGSLPHSEISGSKRCFQLPETYRRYTTSFIASCVPRYPREPLCSFDQSFLHTALRCGCNADSAGFTSSALQPFQQRIKRLKTFRGKNTSNRVRFRQQPGTVQSPSALPVESLTILLQQRIARRSQSKRFSQISGAILDLELSNL